MVDPNNDSNKSFDIGFDDDKNVNKKLKIT